MTSHNPVAIVTGAARPWGLGRAVAIGMAERGHSVVIADIRKDWGAETQQIIKERTGRNALFVQTDVSRRASVEAMVRATAEAFGRVDALLNVAAVLAFERIDEMKDETFDRLMNVNLRGPMLTCQAVVPIMRKQGGGRIVNVASGGAVQPLKGLGVYSASKAGLIIFSKILAWEVAGDSIVVTVVAPGAMRTAMGQEKGPDEMGISSTVRGLPFNRVLLPEEVAEVCVYAATSPSHALTGQTLHANGGGYMV